MTTSETYKVPAENLAGVYARFAELRKRARKNGLELPEITCDGEPVTERVNLSFAAFGKVFHKTDDIAFYSVTVTNPTVHIEGWSPVATLEFNDEDSVPMTYEWPGETLPKEFFNARPECDHCGHHRQRKLVYILRDDDGNHKAIGSTCVKDFIGVNPFPKYEALRGSIRDLFGNDDMDEDFYLMDYDGPKARKSEELALYLAGVSALIRLDGWRKNDPNDPRSTAKLATLLYHNNTQALRSSLPRGSAAPSVREEDLADGKAAVEAAKALPSDHSVSYLRNLKVLGDTGYIRSGKQYGLAASMMNWYRREQEKARRAALRREQQAGSEFLGKPGVRLRNVEVYLSSTYTIDRDYGPSSTLHRLEDRKGNVIVWWASGSGEKLPLRKWTKIDGTVKRHETREGIAQTIFTRCREVSA